MGPNYSANTKIKAAEFIINCKVKTSWQVRLDEANTKNYSFFLKLKFTRILKDLLVQISQFQLNSFTDSTNSLPQQINVIWPKIQYSSWKNCLLTSSPVCTLVSNQMCFKRNNQILKIELGFGGNNIAKYIDYQILATCILTLSAPNETIVDLTKNPTCTSFCLIRVAHRTAKQKSS